MARHHSFILGLLLVFFASSSAWAIGPLSAGAKEQVDLSTADLTPDIDTPGFYPLLADADTWDPKDQSGAMIPDYEAILAKSRESRGNVYLIEGIFAGIPRDDTPKVKHMVRPGTWEGRLERWTVITNREADKIVIVYLTHPPTALPEPGATVRLAARYYKVWSYQDLNNKSRSALVFVGATPQIGPGTVSAIGDFHPTTQLPAAALSLAIIALFIVFLIIRRRIAKKFAARDPMDFTNRDREERTETADPSGPLPSDPIEALAELERRRAAAKDDDALRK